MATNFLKWALALLGLHNEEICGGIASWEGRARRRLAEVNLSRDTKTIKDRSDHLSSSNFELSLRNPE